MTGTHTATFLQTVTGSQTVWLHVCVLYTILVVGHATGAHATGAAQASGHGLHGS